jgi:cation transporter-like permease
MKGIRQHLEELRKIRKRDHHPLIHHIHTEHKISNKTLFYVKEYGARTNVTDTILKESIQILLLSAILSAAGGMALENIKDIFIVIVPLIILMPTLNDMVGDYGTIISSRFSTMLHEGKVKRKWWTESSIKILFWQIFIIALLTTLISTTIALIVSLFSNYALNALIILKVFAITTIDVAFLVIIMFISSVVLGLHYFNKKEDPNNFLIPIITSVADFGNMIIMAVLVVLLF